MPNLGPTELIIILVIVIIIFGAGKLADVGGALGKGVKEFKQATKDIEDVKEDLADIAPSDAKESKKA
jgi:sec-independent protein translocase protein TatA